MHDSLANEVMHPKKNEPPLSVVDLSTSTVESIQYLLEDTEYLGYPCVLTASTQLLVGYITRKDLEYVVGECMFICVCVSMCGKGSILDLAVVYYIGVHVQSCRDCK